MCIESVIQAFSEPDLRESWSCYLADALDRCKIMAGLSVRFVLCQKPSYSISLASGPRRSEMESFLAHHPTRVIGANVPRQMPWTIPVAAIELRDLPAGIYATGENPSDVQEALGRWSDKAPLRQALAHSQRVLEARLKSTVRQAQAKPHDALMLLDRHGQVIHKNGAAVKLLADYADLAGENADHELIFKDKRENAVFREAMKSFFVRQPEQGLRELVGKDLILHFQMPSFEWAPNQLTELRLCKARQPVVVDVEVVRHTLRVPLGQAKLAKAMLDGKNLKQFAKDMHLTRSGVRYHLGPLMKRLDCHSQAELMRTLLRMFG